MITTPFLPLPEVVKPLIGPSKVRSGTDSLSLLVIGYPKIRSFELDKWSLDDDSGLA